MAFMINALSADLTVASCLLEVTFFLSLDIEIRFDLKFGVYKSSLKIIFLLIPFAIVCNSTFPLPLMVNIDPLLVPSLVVGFSKSVRLVNSDLSAKQCVAT